MKHAALDEFLIECYNYPNISRAIRVIDIQLYRDLIRDFESGYLSMIDRDYDEAILDCIEKYSSLRDEVA